MIDNFRLAIGNLRTNLLRTALTMLGIIIGVGAVIILLSVGQSFETFIVEEFESLGVNLTFVVPNFEADEIQPLTFSDAEALSNPANVPDAANVMPEVQYTLDVRVGTNEVSANIEAVTPVLPALFGRTLVGGRFFDESEMATNARVAVIEAGLASQLFPDSFPIGQSIRVDNVQFNVIGILAAPDGQFSFSDGDSIFIPITTAQTRLNNNRIISGEQAIDFIIVQGQNPDRAQTLNRQIQQTLREVRGVTFRDEDNFLIISQSEIIDTLDEITSLLTVFLVILASISLLVGGIGIMNIMLVTVTERTREIGLRKAVGAQNIDILLQFLTEAVLLSVIGGIIGVIIAYGVTVLVTALIPDLTVIVQISSIGLAMIVSIVVGLLSGGYPAYRAANLNPIDALRYE